MFKHVYAYCTFLLAIFMAAIHGMAGEIIWLGFKNNLIGEIFYIIWYWEGGGYQHNLIWGEGFWHYSIEKGMKKCHSQHLGVSFTGKAFRYPHTQNKAIHTTKIVFLNNIILPLMSLRMGWNTAIALYLWNLDITYTHTLHKLHNHNSHICKVHAMTYTKCIGSTVVSRIRHFDQFRPDDRKTHI